MKSINSEVSEYAIALITYESMHQLPNSIFQEPDHIAIRTAGITEFEQAVRSLNDIAEQMVCIEDDDGRFKVSAQIMGTVSLGIYGKVRWLEIIEDQASGIDHAEFYYPDFSTLRERFHKGRVKYKIETANGHRAADVPFSLKGKEYKFRVSDTPLNSIVAEEIDNGDAYILAA